MAARAASGLGPLLPAHVTADLAHADNNRSKKLR